MRAWWLNGQLMVELWLWDGGGGNEDSHAWSVGVLSKVGIGKR